MDIREAKYIFKTGELTADHRRFFFMPKVFLIIGIALWTVATYQQMEYLAEKRSTLVAGVLPLFIWIIAYSVAFMVAAKKYPERTKIIYQAVIFLDVIFITLLIRTTGVCQSNFYLAYYLLIAIETFYFGMLGGAVVTFSAGILYMLLYLANSEQLFVGDFALRLGFMFLTYLVLATLEENEKRIRLNIESQKDEIEKLHGQLEENIGRIIEEKHFAEYQKDENARLLRIQQETTLRRRSHIDFAKELNAQDTIEETILLFTRYSKDLLDVDHVAIVTLDKKNRRSILYNEFIDGDIEQKEIPFNHPLIDTFFDEGGESETFQKIWTAGNKEELPDSFLIVPGGKPALLAIESLSGGKHGTSGMIVISSESEGELNSDCMDEVRMLGSHLAIAIENLTLRAKLQELADTDGLTGLFNHRYFQITMDREIRRARRYKRPLSITIFDIDHFKSFNDTYGHPIGDAVLKELAIIAQGALRTTDIIARYGGEEFVVVMPETDKNGALAVAERIRRAIAEHTFEFNNLEPLHVTVSLGVGEMPPTKTKEELIKMADEALYRAKESGRNKVAS